MINSKNSSLKKYKNCIELKEFKSELEIGVWADGTIHLRTFKHRDSCDLCILSNANRIKLIKQLVDFED